MSNTSVISPVAAVTVGCIGGCYACQMACRGNSLKNKFSITGFKVKKNGANVWRIDRWKKLEINTTTLHLRDIEPLVRSG